ncbi:MAG TPA: 4a-hydroxytetrahydrobiopterin dehydratase [Dehalococcoidia bacterium]|nr:4a-hydroxytetrahydrobiopterin dehydratase [Dehalococcoidia bacterium]
MVDKLSNDEIAKALETLPGWSREGDEIRKQYSFNDFLGSIAFVNAVAKLAEDAQHHPDITINYNKVSLALTTHDAGGLSERDVALASRADAAAKH